MPEPKKAVCVYCEREIEKVRTDRAIAKAAFRWKSKGGFYCASSHGEHWHSPKMEGHKDA